MAKKRIDVQMKNIEKEEEALKLKINKTEKHLTSLKSKYEDVLKRKKIKESEQLSALLCENQLDIRDIYTILENEELMTFYKEEVKKNEEDFIE